jgi:NAD(P)-dependent dehydrogenase (short-subunit alcohol dehydrogenase family)
VAQKHTIIVGGTKGVGRELALVLAAEGQLVTAVGRTPGEFADAPKEGKIIGFAGDMEQPESLLASIKDHIAKHGKISSLVFLQRYRGKGDSWNGEMTVSMTATKTLIEGLADAFAADGDKSICVVTSSASTFVARNQSLAYHTSKAALRQMARFYAVKLGSQGIRVNIVSPCTFVKPESAAYYQGQTALQGMYAQITPLGRMGTAREVAETVAFFCGPKASFITGQELAVDGGLSLMLQDAMAREVAGIAG